MSVADLARDFTSMLKNGQHEEAGQRYNADGIVSYEAMDGPMAVCEGRDAVKAKGDWWVANHEIHKATVQGPFVNGDSFAVLFGFDVTVKDTGERRAMDEVGLYTVRDGKIVEERFYY